MSQPGAVVPLHWEALSIPSQVSQGVLWGERTGQGQGRGQEDGGRQPTSGKWSTGWAGSHGQHTLGDRVPRILITTFFLSWSTAT